jgi:hypothetical protein
VAQVKAKLEEVEKAITLVKIAEDSAKKLFFLATSCSITLFWDSGKSLTVSKL